MYTIGFLHTSLCLATWNESGKSSFHFCINASQFFFSIPDTVNCNVPSLCLSFAQHSHGIVYILRLSLKYLHRLVLNTVLKIAHMQMFARLLTDKFPFILLKSIDCERVYPIKNHRDKLKINVWQRTYTYTIEPNNKKANSQQ